jgi:hypothetical protein
LNGEFSGQMEAGFDITSSSQMNLHSSLSQQIPPTRIALEDSATGREADGGLSPKKKIN